MKNLKLYYQLTKPGIIYGNILTASAGFFVAAGRTGSWQIYLAMIAGMSLVIASACTFNNIVDADIDVRMERTKNRPIVRAEIAKIHAVIFGSVLGLLGIFMLWHWTNFLTLTVALIGHLVYVLIYTPLKRRSVHATLVGAISGATPPMIGYTAVVHHLDLGAWLLFATLLLWQMPHFYAIAIRRLDDYAQAHIPVMPLKVGIQKTKIQMFVYLVLYAISSLSLFFFHYSGYLYLVVVSLLILYWFKLYFDGFRAHDQKAWAKKMFLFSLLMISASSLIIIVDAAVFHPRLDLGSTSIINSKMVK